MDTEHPKIAIIGAGFGGICAAIQLEKQLGIKSYTIFDENEHFGGTWLVNTYPGCACDIQSHLYSYSFELNPGWTKNYPSQPEIYAYILSVAKKYGLAKNAKFSTQVKTIEWVEEKSQWEICVLDKNSNLIQNLCFDFLISAVGGLRVPYIPEQFTKFTGPIIHSANWRKDISLTGKKVAVIGSGASAVQIIPAIVNEVKELHSYQRKPAWIQPRMQFEFPKIVLKLFATLPILMWLFRCLIFLYNEFHFNAFQADSLMSRIGTYKTKKLIRQQIPGDVDLQNKLTPNYKLGCKRVLVAENYFCTFTLPQLHLHREIISKVEGTSITTVDGVSRDFDILVLATGFRVQDFFKPLKLTTNKGVDLLDTWEVTGPRTYYGIMSNLVPNGFFLLGPNTALGHNSVIFMIECQVNMALQAIKETIRRKARTITVKKSAEDAWMTRVLAEMKTTVWGSEQCGSWYANADGIITALWPSTSISYYRETKNLDLKAMEFTYDT